MHAPHGVGKGHPTRAGFPARSTCAGATLARWLSVSRARCRCDTASEEISASGLRRSTSPSGARRRASAKFTPAAKPRLAPGVVVGDAELVAHLRHVRRRGVVDHGDRKLSDGLERTAQQIGCTEGDHDDLDRSAASTRQRGVERCLVHLEVPLGDPVPRALLGPRVPGAPGSRSHSRVGPEAHERLAQGHWISGRHQLTCSTDDIRERAGVAGDHGHPAGHGLHGHTSELFPPPGHGQRRYGEHAQGRVEAGKVLVLEGAEEPHPVRDVESRYACAQVGSRRAVPGHVKLQAGIGRDSLEKHVNPLVGSQTSDVPHGDGTGAEVGGAVRPRGEACGVDAEGNGARNAGQSLALGNAAGLHVADADPRGVAQRPLLEPAKRGWIAFGKVLRGVQRVGGGLATEAAQQEELCGREGERLLVDVDDVPLPTHGTPDRSGVIQEQGWVATPGAYPCHLFIALRDQLDLSAAFVPGSRADELDIDVQPAQGSFALPPGIHDRAVGDPENPQRCAPSDRLLRSVAGTLSAVGALRGRVRRVGQDVSQRRAPRGAPCHCVTSCS